MKIKLVVENAEEFFKKEIQNIKNNKLREFLRIHTNSVKESVLILSKNKSLDIETLIVASWVHDIGYVRGEKDHAESSLNILEEANFEVDEKLRDCILNHGNDKKPKTLEGKIFQMADKISIFDNRLLSILISDPSHIEKEDLDYLKYLAESAVKQLKTFGIE